jgi:uncharacterized membrane protein
MLEQLPEWARIFLMSMIPGIESKVSIPFAIEIFGWKWWEAFPLGVAGNMILVPVGLLFFKEVERLLEHFGPWRKAMGWLFPRIRRRAGSKVQRYECAALLFFVAIPLPMTGAGLGTLIAYLFDLPFSRSLLMIFIGVIIAASVTTIVVLTGVELFFS